MPDQVGVKSPWVRPTIPTVIIAAAKTAWPQLAMAIGRVPSES